MSPQSMNTSCQDTLTKVPTGQDGSRSVVVRGGESRPWCRADDGATPLVTPPRSILRRVAGGLAPDPVPMFLTGLIGAVAGAIWWARGIEARGLSLEALATAPQPS